MSRMAGSAEQRIMSEIRAILLRMEERLKVMEKSIKKEEAKKQLLTD